MSFAGLNHTVLLKSDGHVAACGINDEGQCITPDLPDGVTYVPDASLPSRGIQVLQLSCCESDQHYLNITCTSLSGEALCTVTLHKDTFIMSVAARIAEQLAVREQFLRLVLPNGDLSSSIPGSTRVNELLGM